MRRPILTWLGLFTCLCGVAPAAVQDATDGQSQELLAEVVRATPAELNRLLAVAERALSDKDGEALVRVLGEMAAFDNPELAEPALTALTYKLTKVDKAAVEVLAEELGMTSKKDLEALRLEREALVQAAGARLAGNLPDDKQIRRALLKAFKQKDIVKTKPTAYAAVVGALGALGHVKVEKDVFGEYRRYGHEAVMRACVRYFGQIKTRNRAIVRTLCEELTAPEPGDVDAAHNPPASYWAARWELWMGIRRDVTWALEEITGQTFRPAEGDHTGDSRLALQWLAEHGREHGIK